MSREPRLEASRRPAVVTLAVVFVALLATWLWLTLLAGPYRLARGLVDGGRQLSQAQRKLDKGKIDEAFRLTLSASAGAEDARTELEDPSALIDVARLIPTVDDAWGELDHIITAFELSAASSVDALSVVEDALGGGLITKDPEDPDASVIDLDRLQEATRTITRVRDATVRTIAELEKVDLDNLPGRVRSRVPRAITDAKDALERIEIAQRGFTILPSILGANGPRNYLLGFQNPAEQRGTGGAILQFKVLRFDSGRFELTDIISGKTAGTVYNIDKQRQTYDIPLPEGAWMVREIEDAQRFGNANWSPDWPTSAQLMIEYAYTSARVNEEVEVPEFDGFIVVDPLAVEKMMPGVGSFTTKRGDTITPRNIVNFVLYEAYGRYPPPRERRLALAQIVDRFFSKALNSPQLDAMARGVGEALSEKRIQIWMKEPAVHKFIKEMDWDGSIKQARGSDYVFVVEQNVGGNKLDFFDSHTNTIDVRIDGKDALVSTEMRVRNGIFGPQPDWMMGNVGPLHRPMMSLYVPGDAELESWDVEGERLDSPPPAVWIGGRPAEHFEAGKKVWTLTFNLDAGEEGAARFDYRVPSVVRSRRDRSVYRLVIQAQPKVDFQSTRVTLELPEGATAVVAQGWSREGDALVWDKLLRRDVILEVSWRDA